ncbi:MAG: hypothetical protein E7028_07275 [Planctomycetaceae bacterium]|nr:hypothetical protein [Planctomycetaceae bacterium]
MKLPGKTADPQPQYQSLISVNPEFFNRPKAMPNPTPQDLKRGPLRPQSIKPQPLNQQAAKPTPIKPQPLKPAPLKPTPAPNQKISKPVPSNPWTPLGESSTSDQELSAAKRPISPSTEAKGSSPERENSNSPDSRNTSAAANAVPRKSPAPRKNTPDSVRNLPSSSTSPSASNPRNSAPTRSSAPTRPQSLKPQAVAPGTPVFTAGQKNRPMPIAAAPVEFSEEALAFTAELSDAETAAGFVVEKDEYLEANIHVREEEHVEEELSEKIAKGAPPWLLSTIGHVILLLIGALLFSVIPPQPKPIRIECVMVVEEEEEEEEEEIFHEEIGVQQEIETETYVETEQPEAAEMAEEDKPVEDPMLEPEAPPVTETGTLAASLKEAPPGARFDGRTPGGRKGLLGKYGGTKSTQDAVELGLQWLVRQQDKKNGPNRGSWSLAGPYSNGLDGSENRVAATAMALLAFHGAGYTQHPPKLTDEDRKSQKRKEKALKEIKEQGKYRAVIASGWNWLLKQQGPDGQFFPVDAMHNHKFYTHCQATIALCELYGMTKNTRYREPAKKAVEFLVNTQHHDGAWRYTMQKDEMSDLSVTGWALMALQSAKMAELEVPQTAFDGITRYLDSNGGPHEQTYYKYTNLEVYPSMSMTAEGILCRQYLGWQQNDPRMEKALDRLLTEPMSFKGETDVYRWYYTTQAMHHKEGRWWKDWNAVMRQTLPENQIRTGPERGSWNPSSDRFADDQGGRLFMTCLSIYMLEVYYRHLPIYAKIFDENGKMDLSEVGKEERNQPGQTNPVGQTNPPAQTPDSEPQSNDSNVQTPLTDEMTPAGVPSSPEAITEMAPLDE